MPFNLLGVDQAIQGGRRLLDRLPPGHIYRGKGLNHLATALYTRFLITHLRRDLDEAITLHREALVTRPSPHPERLKSLDDLAVALLTRWSQQVDQLEDLSEAILLHREILALKPSPDPERLTAIGDLSLALLSRFEHTGEVSDVNEAISLHREALALRPAPHPDRSESLNDLASAVGARFDKMGKVADLDEAILLYREALELRPAPHSRRSTSLNDLACVLLTRFRTMGRFPDLDEAVSLHRDALILRPAAHPDRSTSLEDLAVAVFTRFEQRNQILDLDEAILLHRESLALRPASHLGRLSSLRNLALALLSRFNNFGQIENLDEAISLLREALASESMPRSFTGSSGTLNNLAMALGTRFKQTHQLSDLNEGISLSRESLALCPAPHPDRSASLNNLAVALNTRFGHTSQLSDLDEAIPLFREALSLRHASHPAHPSSLNNLATALRTRFNRTGALSDLDEAIRLHRDALCLQPDRHPDRSILLNNLAGTLKTRFVKTSQLQDINEAITLCQEALQILPGDHPRFCEVSGRLGQCFLDRFYARQDSGDDIERQMENVNGAMDAFRAAAHCEPGLLSDRFAAARRWVSISDISNAIHGSALEAYETAIGLLPRLAMLGLDLKSRQEAMTSNTDGLARDAVACAIRSQNFGKAIELLEAGRAIFWSQALQLRTPLDKLEDVAPELAQKVKNISRALENGALRDVSRSILDPLEKVVSAENAVSHYRQLNTEWLATIQEVQMLDGFHDFLRTKSFATLSDAAANGTIVILNASRLRSRSQCAAIVMRASQDPLHIPLPQMTYKSVEELLKCMQTFLEPSSRPARGLRHLSEQVPISNSESTFREVLETLWICVVKPILCSLHMEKTNEPPRLWWLPTGPFASLPIHAAGIYSTDNSECVSDYVVSSYTPTLSALLTPPATVAEPFKVLAVIQPTTTGHAALPFTEEELRKIEDHVPNDYLIKFGMPGVPASVQSVLSAIPTASIVHLACHGQQNTTSPLDSALLLEGDQLKAAQLMELSLLKASLVFLSACETATIDDNMPDEPIHLTATMLFCGFRGAIGTMWSIQDRDGPTISGNFYGYLFPPSDPATTRTLPDPMRSAHALHFAVDKLRSSGCSFARWVPFVHLGL